ncbi:thiol-disulfide oxidoreductase DCC family protein [Bacillus sp. FJAT-49736]|uniref:thiol-disulfide oxidoreductase DCC family protein n=1 Tax=Bacillus sp. FJAT-49736 TaxID=2833582 RepID=UPI001BC9F5B8|nr:thiol-disulfide oxidoreductase DCC family protein [Bacillus sp. FJAT-49736]MBS4172757.1 thiol-disulfide oxidoreductase DCC family protein [Bacillus sp. FJAT-49736]
MKNIILFDGVCNFCSQSVQFIIKRDPNGIFHFASLQSDIGKELLKQYGVDENIDSFVYVSEGKAYVKSSAALQVCRRLHGFWKWLYIFYFVPAPIRNSMYDFLAKNRYKWFGKMESCMIPSPEIRSRFLD